MEWGSWGTAFALTLLFEGAVFLALLRRSLSPARALLATLLLNALTHPIAWTTITSAAQPLPYVFLGVEGAGVIAEGLLLFAAGRTKSFRKPLGLGEAVAVALAANAFSAGLGLML